jgi:hypothetical protein
MAIDVAFNLRQQVADVVLRHEVRQTESVDALIALRQAWCGCVDAYKYAALQVQEAARLGFDLPLAAQGAEQAMLVASERRLDAADEQVPR